MDGEQFCVSSFLVICWALSVYLTWHAARLYDYWKEDREQRKRLKSLYNSPWLGPAE